MPDAHSAIDTGDIKAYNHASFRMKILQSNVRRRDRASYSDGHLLQCILYQSLCPVEAQALIYFGVHRVISQHRESNLSGIELDIVSTRVVFVQGERSCTGHSQGRSHYFEAHGFTEWSKYLSQIALEDRGIATDTWINLWKATIKKKIQLHKQRTNGTGRLHCDH